MVSMSTSQTAAADASMVWLIVSDGIVVGGGDPWITQSILTPLFNNVVTLTIFFIPILVQIVFAVWGKSAAMFKYHAPYQDDIGFLAYQCINFGTVFAKAG